MRYLFILFLSLAGAAAWAQEHNASLTPDPTSTPVVLSNWKNSTVPWDEWFKKNAMVTDKGDHVHFFWNAQDYKLNFDGKEKKARLAAAALQLVSRLYPADAKADAVRVDIVYVLERDSYGMPKWDSLEQVAHLEFSKAKTKKLAKSDKDLTEAQMKKVFTQFETY